MTPVVVDAPASGEPMVRVLVAPLTAIPAPRTHTEALPSVIPLTSWDPEPAVAGPVDVLPSVVASAPGGRHLRPEPEPHSRRWVDHLLTVLALVGVLVAGLTVFAARSGLQPLVVRSGSMEPTIASGAMVLVRQVPASSLAVGDVVAVERPDHTRVTHRIVAITSHGRTAELTLKGDANEDPDPQPVTVAHAGLLVRDIPLLGRLGGFVASAKGGFVLGWPIAMVTLVVLRRRPS
jgi:signal peptidase I